jgi:hypothetical protein
MGGRYILCWVPRKDLTQIAVTGVRVDVSFLSLEDGNTTMPLNVVFYICFVYQKMDKVQERKDSLASAFENDVLLRDDMEITGGNCKTSNCIQDDILT